MNYLVLILKGVMIGFFMLVPGISGGSIAIILGIYDDLINKVNNLFKNFKTNVFFLIILFIGGVIGLIASSFLIDFVIKNIYFELIYLFLGVMFIYIFKNITNKDGYSFTMKLVFIFLGILMGYMITLIPTNILTFENNYLLFFLLGIFLAIALILPGISVSYVLLVFSLYDEVITAIKAFDFIFLLKLGIFLFLGIFLVIRLMSYLLNNKKRITENVIIGFIISSIWLILPSITTYKEIVYATIFFTLGIILKKCISQK